MTDEINNKPVPESDNEDYEELVFDVSLEKTIAHKVIDEALAMGLEPEDWMKFIIGAVVTNRMSGPYFTEQDDPPGMPSKEALEQGAERIGHMIRHVMAQTGNLTCNNCTQRLTVEELRQGHCNHCEAPIDG